MATISWYLIAACENLLHPSQNFSPEIFSKKRQRKSVSITIFTEIYPNRVLQIFPSTKKKNFFEHKESHADDKFYAESYHPIIVVLIPFDFKQNRESLIFIEKRKPTDDKVFGTNRFKCHRSQRVKSFIGTWKSRTMADFYRPSFKLEQKKLLFFMASLLTQQKP